MNHNSEIKRQAVNPYLPSWEYIPDGEPHIFNERLYVYGSHDRFNGTQFCMNDYVCWSAPLEDLSNWSFEGEIYNKKQDPNANENSIMQAPDVCKGLDGKYYLYYTLGLSPVMAVAVCDSPAGQFQYYGLVKYADGTPVGLKKHDLFQFDPSIFIDDDNKIWLYSGFGVPDDGPYANAIEKYKLDGAYCMELDCDMLTIKTGPTKILSKYGDHGFFEASSMRKINGKYVFVYASTLVHELCYAECDEPDGEFIYRGTLLSIGDIGITETPRNYLGNTHGGLVKIEDKWYIFYHRQTNQHQYSRQACAEYIEMDKNGKFIQAELTSCGLNNAPLSGNGDYEARIACNLWARDGAITYGHLTTPEAKKHPFFTQSGNDREGNGDQYIANIFDGSTAGYKYFECNNLFKIVVEATEVNGEFWVFIDLNAEPICKIPLNKPYKFAEFDPITGKVPLYFVYYGEGSTNFYRFYLEEQK